MEVISIIVMFLLISKVRNIIKESTIEDVKSCKKLLIILTTNEIFVVRADIKLLEFILL